ncbi:MAG: O-antigen ligase family protein [Flavobacterium sp.]
MLKPILGLIIGYQFYKNDIKNPFAFLLKAGIAMAIIHLVLVSYGILIEGARNVREIRHYGGFFNDYEVYALVFLLFRKKLGISLSQQKFYIYLFILSFSAIFYLARTNFIQFFILTIALRGYLELNKKNVYYLGALLAITITSYMLILWYNPKRNGPGIDEFLFKVKNAPIEAFSTKINRENWKDFHDNYRSYENIRTIQQLEENSSVWFGEGIGSQVDLKQKVYLGDMELRKISILHNGYMTVLLKSGIIGLIIYIASIFYFFKSYRSINIELKNIHQIFIGTGVFLIISNWVFMGFYNPVDTKSLIIGFLFAYKFDLLKRNQN